MIRVLPWILQILILSAGIHLFLRFVRHTRGSRLIRGLYVSVLLAWVGLWGLSKPLGLEELEHILQGATGFLVVVFAIVFQPELRRGIAQLGERSFGGGLTSRSDPDVVRAVVRGARSMAARRHGALIAFEKETSLKTYVETGAEVDAEVSARLIESLFNPKGPLHDGAIVIQEGRIAAAGCFFPLPQEGEFDPSMGTRHRAALGLTEDNDAVVLVVSEETGSISIAHEGAIRSNVTEDKLEEELQRLLASTPAGDRAARRRLLGRSSWRGDIFWLMASVVLAIGILAVAHQDIRTTHKFTVRISASPPTVTPTPGDGDLLVVLPEEGYRLVQPGEFTAKIAVHGSRSQIDALGGSLCGVYPIDDVEHFRGELNLSEVEWRRPIFGLEYGWAEPPPALEFERYEWRAITVHVEDVVIDDSALNPRYEVRRDGVRVAADSTLRIQGPRDVVAQLLGTIPLELEPVVLTPNDRAERVVRVGLAKSMLDLRLSTAPGESVAVTVPIVAARREAGVVTQEVALVCLVPERAGELGRWMLPAHAQNARFSILTSGLVPAHADPGSAAVLERFAAIRRFVEENLRVYVDVAELAEGSREVPVRWTWRKDWREAEELGLEEGAVGAFEELEVHLESEGVVLLEERERIASEEESGG